MGFQVAVCGPRRCGEPEREQAYRVGQLLAEHGVTVICGGGGGVMAAAAAGARSRGGLVIGIRPSASREGSSADLSATIVTNMGEARNAIIVWSADAVISVGGSWGTLSEIALAMRRGDIPVVSLAGWRLHEPDGAPVLGISYVDDPKAAVEAALADRPVDV